MNWLSGDGRPPKKLARETSSGFLSATSPLSGSAYNAPEMLIGLLKIRKRPSADQSVSRALRRRYVGVEQFVTTGPSMLGTAGNLRVWKTKAIRPPSGTGIGPLSGWVRK
jgi:hypothetical protein